MAKFFNRDVPPDIIFGLYELTLRLWKYGANSGVKCIRRLRLWACTHVEYGWVASGPWMASVLQISPADDVVFVFVLSVFQSRNRKSTCKNTAHPHVFVFVVCRSRNLSNVFTKIALSGVVRRPSLKRWRFGPTRGNKGLTLPTFSLTYEKQLWLGRTEQKRVKLDENEQRVFACGCHGNGTSFFNKPTV